MTPEDRLGNLGIALPTVSPPLGTYEHAVRVGSLLYLSGKGPRLADGSLAMGKVGVDVTLAEGYQHARSAGLALIAVMKETLGSLSSVRRVVKVLGMVNSAPEFRDHPKVINGCSDLFVEVFGDRGRHARSAVGMAALPGGISVEIEAIVEVD